MAGAKLLQLRAVVAEACEIETQTAAEPVPAILKRFRVEGLGSGFTVF
jgi:hypothetical protein